MKEYIFYKMDEKAAQMVELAGLTLPVRVGMEEEVFKGDQADLSLLLDELDAFLTDYPQYLGNYRDAIGKLCYLVGVKLGSEGYTEMALHYFEWGLRLNPTNLSLRSNYAIALHSLGRLDEALQQLEMIIDDPDVGFSPIIWIMAARLYARKGEHFKSYQLLNDCAKHIPNEENFWYFLSDMKARAGLEEEDTEEISRLLEEAKALEAQEAMQVASGLKCTSCQAQLPAGAKFCKSCGASVGIQASQANICANCGNPLKPGAKFCNHCGSTVK